MKKFEHFVNFILILLFVAFTVYFTNRCYYLAFSGDGYAHATKIKFLVDFWPNINWVYFWGNGIPVFLWYGFMPYAFLVLFYQIFSSTAIDINSLHWLTIFLIGLGIYGLVFEVTGSRKVSLLASFLTIPSPGLWYRVMVGTAPRTFGDGWLVLSLWFLIKALKQDFEKNLRPGTVLGLIILTGLAFQDHFFTFLLTGLFELIVIVVIAKNWGQKIKFLFLTFLPAFLLSAYFLIPFMVTQHLNQAVAQFGLFAVSPMDLKLLFYHPPERVAIPGGGLLPIHLPLLIILLPILFLSRKLKESIFVSRVFWAFMVLLILFLLFGGAIYFGYPATWYNLGFCPDQVFEYLSLIVPILTAILVWLVIPKKGQLIFCGFLMMSVIGLVVWQYPSHEPFAMQLPTKSDARTVYGDSSISYLLAGKEAEKNYRYAHPATEIAGWFSTDYQIPQNREYFPQGVMNPNWRSWQENAIWNVKWDNKMSETKFLLDWFAIRWFSLIPGFNLNNAKYQNDVDFQLKVGGPDQAMSGYEYQRVSPILSSTTAPAILVIGEKTQDRSYGPLMRILAMFNYNSQVIVPIRGKKAIDEYKLEELQKFPLLFIYEYRIDSPYKAGKLITDYLKSGGRVIIETSSFMSEANRKIFESYLGFQSIETEISEKWDFSGQNQLSEGVDFNQFSPPDFDGYPWKVWAINLDGLKKEVLPVVVRQNQAVIVRKGNLIWSGLNLPYHIQSYQNEEEGLFLTKIIFDLLARSPEPNSGIDGQVQFISPQKRVIEISQPATGVLFRENYFFNWHAYLQQGGQKTKLTIYPAGTDFMYVPLGKPQTGKVVIYYRRSLMEQLSLAVSIISLIGLITVMFIIKKGNPVLVQKLKSKSIGRLSSWWQKDNDG